MIRPPAPATSPPANLARSAAISLATSRSVRSELRVRLDRGWEPVLALVASWPDVTWPAWGLDAHFDGAFVSADPVCPEWPMTASSG
jgi:hypothetical protein